MPLHLPPQLSKFVESATAPLQPPAKAGDACRMLRAPNLQGVEGRRVDPAHAATGSDCKALATHQFRERCVDPVPAGSFIAPEDTDEDAEARLEAELQLLDDEEE